MALRPVHHGARSRAPSPQANLEERKPPDEFDDADIERVGLTRFGSATSPPRCRRTAGPTGTARLIDDRTAMASRRKAHRRHRPFIIAWKRLAATLAGSSLAHPLLPAHN